ncbi:hypothetical protein RJT34_22002 [Clitoria ternatea]|uniref:Uncharacterized protein n=1 Tax=Clitoria ternatea TaxID=43366 RepID=A0AAN9P626_CLITE
MNFLCLFCSLERVFELNDLCKPFCTMNRDFCLWCFALTVIENLKEWIEKSNSFDHFLSSGEEKSRIQNWKL